MPESQREQAMTARACWCGNTALLPFSADYARCGRCETLVSQAGLSAPETLVKDDETDFYGKRYWHEHQTGDLGYGDIRARARADLPERCAWWLRGLLRYKAPPARVLELGSAHGGFVALLRQAGYDAAGLELSPWVVGFARETFGVPMLCGPLEEQDIAPGSLDAIALMDVLEHLPDPAATLAQCLRALAPDGVLLIQTPRYPAGKGHDAMVAENDRFLEQLKSDEHLYLYSEGAVREFLERLGAGHVCFEPAIFSHYDLFLVASRQPPAALEAAAQEAALAATPGGRLAQALMDAVAKLEECQRDGAARLEQINRLGAQLSESEADRAARLEAINRIGADLHAAHRELAEARRTLGRWPVALLVRLLRKLGAA